MEANGSSQVSILSRQTTVPLARCPSYLVQRVSYTMVKPQVVLGGTSTDWVYDEHGIFDYSGLGGPRNSSRENYDNDTHHHELSDMGKQWVFLNDLAQRYDSEVDLLHEIRNQQTTIPPELHPSELEMLRERLDDPAYHVDRIRMAYRLGGLDGAITTGLNDFMEQHRHLSPAVYEAMLEEKIETATILSVNEQFRDILNAYDEHQTNLITMMNRNADLESFLSIAHATSQQWRDPDFVQSIMQDNQSADAILQSLSEQDLSNHARLSESFNNNSLKNIFDAYTPLNTIDGDSWNPTTLYETTYNLHDTLTYLVASTDWANEITSNPRNTVNGSNLATVQANLPDEVVALSNSHLAYSITEDLTDEDRARLVDLMDAHAQQHGYQQVDPPTVENYNLNRVMVGGLIGVSIASEVLGDSIDLVSATLSGLRGDAVGVAADLSGILAPRALGYLDDFVQGGRRLVGEVVDAERRTGEWLEGFFRRQFVDGHLGQLLSGQEARITGTYWQRLFTADQTRQSLAIRIDLNPEKATESGFTHEFGHVLDVLDVIDPSREPEFVRLLLGSDGYAGVSTKAWANIEDVPELSEWLDTVRNSRLYQELNTRVDLTGPSRVLRDLRQPFDGRYRLLMGRLAYHAQPEELWARSYEQYIYRKTGNLPDEIIQFAEDSVGKDNAHLLVWDSVDFEPIMEAFDNIFRRKGWLNE
jgi:hypothetical protein